MMKIRIIRCFSTRVIVDKWFKALQSPTHNEQQSKLAHCIEYTLQQDPSIHYNLIKDIIHRWTIEQPKTNALWTNQINNNESQKLTFNDINIQSSHFASILTGNEFNLTPGKSVLVYLPYSSKERILIELACLQSDLVFCSYDLKYLSENDIRQQIRTLAVDCIITNVDHLDMIMHCTYNSLRPLKKGLINHSSISKPLPIGWHSLMHNINNNDLRIGSIQYPKGCLRHLTNDRPIDQYSQSRFAIMQLLTAYWLNMNKSPSLIWIKNTHNKISLAPWLLGSTIFHKETDNIETIFKTFENYPIDTFCASQSNYQLLDKQQQFQNNIQLKQLFSVEPIIDPIIKTRWHSLTNLHIQDDFPDSNNKTDTKSYLTSFKYKQLENTHETNQHRT
ncbi:unnamed protein product [Adineta steineri]|uniref:AMP-dependent synthetase/ligase domain-containing protein n=1 Tax=Adineta steineri TaxID=433720 RepID=A0A818TN79_9BILA|nr:unnamed protein product [Adineta steineri]CAF3681850.1 unnamed protein product [Adineta steineri]